MRILQTFALIFILALPLRAQAPTVAERLGTAHEISSNLAVMFQSVMYLDPGYRALAAYFMGRAEAYAEAYYMLTGVTL